jgi:hypothetical protein
VGRLVGPGEVSYIEISIRSEALVDFLLATPQACGEVAGDGTRATTAGRGQQGGAHHGLP